MKRLLLWIILLTILFCGVIPIIGVLGKTTPPPEFAKWFTYPDGSPCPMPCLFGIRPGVTKFEDVEHILMAHPATSKHNLSFTEGYFLLLFQDKSRSYLEIKGSANDIVKEIYWQSPTTNGISLDIEGAFVLFGTPSGISWSPYNDTSFIVLEYRELTMLIDIMDHQKRCLLSAGVPIFSIAMYPAHYQEVYHSRRTIYNALHYAKWNGIYRRPYAPKLYGITEQSDTQCTY